MTVEPQDPSVVDEEAALRGRSVPGLLYCSTSNGDPSIKQARRFGNHRHSSQPLCKSSLPPPDTILCNPQLQVDFFSHEICKALCAFDSIYNPERIVTVSRADASLLFFSLSRYLTAAYFNTNTSTSNGCVVARNAQTETLHRLKHEITELDMSKQTKIEEVLMAVIMYGLSTNWDGSNDPSFMHYNAAVSTFHHTYQDANVEPRRSRAEGFFPHLLDPPVIENETRIDNFRIWTNKIVPHPLAGVSPQAQLLLGRVGSLVYAQRLRCRERSFTSMNNIHKEYRALQEARQLEEELLILELPQEDEFVDVTDPDTPLKDLFTTADAYRLSALVLLYRTFPDLLEVRLSWRLSQGTYSCCHSQEERRLLWVTALALHVLDLLCQNAPGSGTRSIQQILLIIVAGELRMPQSSLTMQAFDDSSTDSISPETASSVTTSTKPEYTDIFDVLDHGGVAAVHDRLGAAAEDCFCQEVNSESGVQRS
ncbi:uncharacterized protein Z518_01448 [Rhinocladiella mackenziei CBS 650.93]|uniref:Transcription factor domain-containing protein n=1 Tax=Rhinocladiella mackenziei CBS 650.93 TaxID=1442369 RepID=A0A0D2J3R7_9EURO|nr:uncharacterized protein Z518_01448 [Rhinocladiella mackenziei CBS 650.93]KIX10366.1 hypothetical protein Z518_01448 [Rhinocladiella mackenziei CBS 650.93]